MEIQSHLATEWSWFSYNWNQPLERLPLLQQHLTVQELSVLMQNWRCSADRVRHKFRRTFPSHSPNTNVAWRAQMVRLDSFLVIQGSQPLLPVLQASWHGARKSCLPPFRHNPPNDWCAWWTADWCGSPSWCVGFVAESASPCVGLNEIERSGIAMTQFNAKVCSAHRGHFCWWFPRLWHSTGQNLSCCAQLKSKAQWSSLAVVQHLQQFYQLTSAWQCQSLWDVCPTPGHRLMCPLHTYGWEWL